MLGLFRKTTVLSAAFMLLWQGVCLAESVPCTCTPDTISTGPASTGSASCCCDDSGPASSEACPHCQKSTNSQPFGEHEAAHPEGCCNCRLAVPATGMLFSTPNVTETEYNAVSLLSETAAPFQTVCHRELSGDDVSRLPLSDPSFRQIILCVWLT